MSSNEFLSNIAIDVNNLHNLHPLLEFDMGLHELSSTHLSLQSERQQELWAELYDGLLDANFCLSSWGHPNILVLA